MNPCNWPTAATAVRYVTIGENFPRLFGIHKCGRYLGGFEGIGRIPIWSVRDISGREFATVTASEADEMLAVDQLRRMEAERK